MTIEEFFSLFLDELRGNSQLTGYYRFLDRESKHCFRKNYFCRRLEFIQQHAGPVDGAVWDCGCGFGTTGIFLALNGYTVWGTTVETQFAGLIPNRLGYWSRFGDVSGFTWGHEDLFDRSVSEPRYDRLIVQDTLHHLEPIDRALMVLAQALRPGGQIIAIEENGRNVLQRLRLFLRRGNRRVRTVYDEHLGKTILLGDENIRPLAEWERLLCAQGLDLADYEYIRLFLPWAWSLRKYDALQAREKALWRSHAFLREYGYVGVNFVAVKKGAEPCKPLSEAL